ncbi:MAG: outer membrane beta-barrel protein [Gammaproteobacteria bacterium]
MKKIKIIALATAGFAALSASVTAFAVAPLPSGWYLDANVGASRATNVSYATNSSKSNTGWGSNLNVGYKFMPFLGGEIGYTWYSQIKAKAFGTNVATANNSAFDVAAKAILPIGTSGAELFAKLGVARLRSEVKATNTAFANANGILVNTGTHHTTGYYFGIGGDYSFYPSMSVHAQWQRAKGNNTTGNFDLYSIGLTYLVG